MTATRTTAADRRHNRSLRDQAQAWFDALRIRINEIEGADAIATLMTGWKRPEDVMRDYPVLVPLFLDLAWQSRKTPGFAELFQTENGEVAEAPTDILARSQKSFDEIVIAHLMGTMRLTCERRQTLWLGAERERRRSALSRVPVLGALLRGIGLIRPIKTEVLLADYPQKGLYETLKPALGRRAQFALVEALSLLPTRTVSLLGPVIDTLESPTVIRTLADLDRAAVKIAIEMAEAFVLADTGAKTESKDADLTAARGAALSGLLAEGPGFVTLAVANRQLAKDAITKLAPATQGEVWTICRDLAALGRIAECPAAVAGSLQALTAEINERISIALSEIEDGRVAAYAVTLLREKTEADTFLSWIRDETYLTAWKQLAHNLNRTPSTPAGDQPLGPNLKAAIKTTCERGAQVFVDLAEPARKAA